MVDKKQVYFFGGNKTEGNGKLKSLLGGKGAYLAEMALLGIPVPHGFTITTDTCMQYLNDGNFSKELLAQIEDALKKLETSTNKKFGNSKDPLLVSVRSGAKISMPGMMDTVLNLGLNDESVKGLATKTGNGRFSYDSYRRFLAMFGNVVLGINSSGFESILECKKTENGVKLDTELSVESLKEIVNEFKDLIKNKTGRSFPQDTKKQLIMAIQAVFKSWNIPRAITYRKLHKIPHNLGTAVNIQSMVYGNMGETSGTGVAFTRNPATGENKLFGEYLLNAQGEDVVAGIRTPLAIDSLKETMPDIFKEFIGICTKLEQHFKDMQDIEFTIEENKLYILQSRTGMRTVRASFKIACDMVDEGLIDKNVALLRIKPSQIDRMLHPRISSDTKYTAIASGLAASPGAAVGKVAFTAEQAELMAKDGIKTILVRTETSPEDIDGMNAAEGILTVRGGMTSHAAVVARGMGKPCVTGCGDIVIDMNKGIFTVNGLTIKEGDFITIDGTKGNVILGKLELKSAGFSKELKRILSWANEIKSLNIRANADTPEDAELARAFGAEGIGLCRTEHMFFGDDRIALARKMIMATNETVRKEALSKLLPIQKNDFLKIFKVMDGLPVTIRLLDPPLNEFLPSHDDLVEKVHELEKEAEAHHEKEINEIRDMIEHSLVLREINPMLGHRGCRLGITYPEIYEMQVKAIMEAACELKKDGIVVAPEIMIPLISNLAELRFVKKNIIKVAEKVIDEAGIKVDYLIGTMIELPRAAITADLIAQEAEFFSFGTNDLTQTTYGFSRDDAGKFIPYYIEHGVLDCDPFSTLDQEGVGELIKIGIKKGRSSRPEMKMGICGEHGGDSDSVKFSHAIGLNYVSCSPYRIPIAQLAAAQAVIEDKK